ncbi:putative microtubule-associated protein, MAP65/Ase1/PRC1 [Helianthus annuus]|uniref:Microtubule-associated protein, MAP65/Ase1/PRC1 n=2 Tax=Helianthus annuus TaxID=4232 RepID=A0A9K3IE97_HELAN|nr:65-kDa microtubule-associated protein 3 [Helianthus annuus]XP_021977427.1 65-kDa microtubule-associated protein 3 [Helianthus annuus]KAF5795243.1 putative microtubule-associated protein, MAP65/Ase1/PRC1 [Helianthus annuus]KAJ0546748.1 putative microtubule-associated protein, MAP65/Ase1/PRC1 [Helianthus annuus]KAJ0553399.1 putative microtubule-associated protein, MAP65/Ase1/PRC1 [Helianthus annuus]KAJ0719059.1 putative microtubule-associated protein, MAP65/Ase1/PRC1 [Helianthus annuus]KAJ07
MSTPTKDPLMQVETTCGSLLHELQIIWDEVGESDVEKDKMLLELERECLEVYRRKVDLANRSRAQLRKAIAECEAELATVCSAMGERPVHIRQSDQNTKSLKAELRAILPELEEMRKRKSERKNQFIEVLEQIQKIQMEIYTTSAKTLLDETDLSLRKLEELHVQLQALEKEKSDRIKKVLDHMNTLNSLCLVLGMDFNQTVHEINPGLAETEGTKSLSNDAIGCLAAAIRKLHEVKIERMQRLQNLARSLLELWNLMDTPVEEQQMFQSVTCNIAATEQEITEPNLLSVEFINYVEAEVSRLEALKSSKMKELVFKKRLELEDICRKTHLLPEADSSMEIAMEAIETGAIDPASLLEQIELQIGKVKEEAYSRKEILDKVEKWISACEEECWLEEYNNDDNRYNAGRGAHLTLKRAEKARALVNKLPGMVEALAVKTITWENEKGIDFTYDGIRLLSMLEEYKILRQVKEEERKRQRDEKKLQGQLMAEQEAMFGSKPSPMKQQSGKKGSRMSYGGPSNRRLSLGGAMHAPKTDLHSVRATPNTRHTKKIERQLNNREDGLSAGRRGLDIAGLPANRKHSISETEPPQPQQIFRTPFSPISSTESSKTNISLLEDLNRKHEMLQKTFQTSNNNTPFTTPSKTLIISATDDENRTPKTNMIPMVPCTPSTISVPMQTAMTPAPASMGVDQIKKMMIPEEIVEYSFEERRAGFVLPRTHLKAVVAV